MEVEEIVVTGSRIKRAGIDTFYPAISVGTEELEDGAFTNIADALNEIPAFGTPDASPFGNQADSFSVGQNFVDFLGLGAQRTLTLVNGRRFVSANTPQIFGQNGGLQVDYNVIPVALVERIETIGVGGARECEEEREEWAVCFGDRRKSTREMAIARAQSGDGMGEGMRRRARSEERGGAP